MGAGGLYEFEVQRNRRMRGLFSNAMLVFAVCLEGGQNKTLLWIKVTLVPYDLLMNSKEAKYHRLFATIEPSN